MSISVTRPPFWSKSSLPKIQTPIEVDIKDTEVIIMESVQSNEEIISESKSNIDQEAFVLNSRVSINFGVIGLGQAGGKIADAFATCRLPGKDFATYPTLAINTCVADLHALTHIPENYRIALPNYHLGAMRQPEVGYAAISQDGVIDDILDRVERVFKPVDHIIVTAGIGGGTATGTVQILCEALAERDHHVTVMLTLPRNLDSVEEKKNTVDFLAVFQELLFSGVISSAIVVDNNLLYERYLNKSQNDGIDLDWRIDSNHEIVRIINEMNATTGLPSPTTFDGAELTKILSSGGCVTFGKAQITLPDATLQETLALKLKEILHSGYLANYTNLSEARFAGIQIVMPLNIEFGTMMEEVVLAELKHEMPTLVGTYVGHAQVEDQKNVLVYSIVSGMGLPGRAQDLALLLQTEVDLINDAETKRTQFTATEINLKSPFQKIRQKSTSNPFAKEQPTTISKSSNPFSQT